MSFGEQIYIPFDVVNIACNAEIEYTENINIPICACLISKYPYKNQMESILNTFVKS